MRKTLLKDVANIIFCGTRFAKKPSDALWVTPANLFVDNIVSDISKDSRFETDATLKVCENDIIIKRINSQFINLFDKDIANIYAVGNLILVRATKINAKYLAFVLNSTIKSISLKASVGAVIPSLSRADLEELEIPLIPERQQKLIGELWIKGIDKKIHKEKLLNLEHQKEIYYLKEFIGGKMR